MKKIIGGDIIRQKAILRQATQQQSLTTIDTIKKISRGGKIIWNGKEKIMNDHLVDACDSKGEWYESYIVSNTNSVRVHYMGWSEEWDEDIPIEDINNRLRTLNSKTKNWRTILSMNDYIEIKCIKKGIQGWTRGYIVELSVPESWVDVSRLSNGPVERFDLFGDDICPNGMHIPIYQRLKVW